MIGTEMNDDVAATDTDPRNAESRGCLFALSQPPLMLFLTVIGVLLLFTALHDLLRW
jgi:hypothetical protein